MRRGKKNQGFTLIELMIVIAIIAIIAAIAIPGLLSSQRASNERNASASLKTLASAEADFRGNDRDGNGVQDFYTGDVAGLFTLCPVAVAESVKLIELSVALADAGAPFGAAAANAAGSVGAVANFGIQSAKAAYWYRALTTDETAVLYALVTNGRAPFTGSICFNTSKFGFCAFPDTRSSGRNLFFINEGNTIYKRGVTATYVRPGTGAIPLNAIPVAQLTGAGGTNPATWPTDALLATDYSKMD
jgi:prepilin-type N-terminal cleavage/methylation domain-containing protein